jgi:hypothetical protein
MNLPNENFNGRTPHDTIMDGDGHLVEARVEKLVHLHEAFVALGNLFNRYRDVPELEETWNMLLLAVPRYNQIMGA